MRQKERGKNTVREMAGGYGSSSITITLLLQRDLLIQCKIDTWIWFHPVDPYKALVALRALLPSLVAYLPMNFDSKPSYKSMSAFQWRESSGVGGGWTRAGRLCSRRETRNTHPARKANSVCRSFSVLSVFLLNFNPHDLRACTGVVSCETITGLSVKYDQTGLSSTIDCKLMIKTE